MSVIAAMINEECGMAAVIVQEAGEGLNVIQLPEFHHSDHACE
jgi:hypothetical protein